MRFWLTKVRPRKTLMPAKSKPLNQTPHSAIHRKHLTVFFIEKFVTQLLVGIRVRYAELLEAFRLDFYHQHFILIIRNESSISRILWRFFLQNCFWWKHHVESAWFDKFFVCPQRRNILFGGPSCIFKIGFHRIESKAEPNGRTGRRRRYLLHCWVLFLKLECWSVRNETLDADSESIQSQSRPPDRTRRLSFAEGFIDRLVTL